MAYADVTLPIPAFACSRCLLANEAPQLAVTIYEGRSLCVEHFTEAVDRLLSGSRDILADAEE